MNRRRFEEQLVACITEYKESTYRLAYSYVHNQEDALDIVQEAIQKAFVSLDTLHKPASMKSWYFRIVVTTALDFIRKQKRVQPVDEETLLSFGLETEDHYHNLDLEQALEELPFKYKSVIMLRYFEDLKIEEVADILGENVNTIKTRIYQALRLLRVKLKDDSMEEVHQHA
ncbi:RNA polymerase sigma factor [Paenibacillus sp. 1001270B_150601_E10]|uniref:RNA polymerase sigma factor n=1 Tax=Paenibacillus sp. 1001270B_150601_E10 TaxID=2787079 RepID=UPI00189ECACD|nr:RNA polymerase sigma factor [Paenibacillus sp. 1001270B_150601_E10]